MAKASRGDKKTWVLVCARPVSTRRARAWGHETSDIHHNIPLPAGGEDPENGAVYCRFLILFRKQLFRTISVTACALDGSHEDKDKKGRRRKREGSKKGKILYRWRVSTTGNTEGSEKSNTEREEKGDAKAKGRGIKKMEDKGSRHNTSCSLFVSASSLLNHNTSWQVHVFSTKIILGARQPNPLSHPSLYS